MPVVAEPEAASVWCEHRCGAALVWCEHAPNPALVVEGSETGLRFRAAVSQIPVRLSGNR